MLNKINIVQSISIYLSANTFPTWSLHPLSLAYLEYVQKIYDQTSSSQLAKMVKKWNSNDWIAIESRQGLAYTILVELLA